MQNVLENAADAVEMPEQHPGLVSRIFRDYRNNLGLFWQVMLPLIIVNLLFYMGISLFWKLMSPGGLWMISTESHLAAHPAYPSSSQSGLPTGVTWGMNLSTTSHVSLLWLAMCPLIFIIVQRRNSINPTFKTTWQQTLRKTVPILGIALFIGILIPIVPVAFSFLVFEIFLKNLIPSHSTALLFVSAWISLAWFLFTTAYLFVKWSLYNQGLMIENLSAMGALRRSSELVRGRTWWRLLGIYLLLIYVTTVLTSVLLGLTIVFLSFAVPEFIPMREMLLPQRFISLFFFGFARVSIDNAPNYWTIGAMVSVHTLIHAILAPVWASLTTHLYTERVDEHTPQVST